MIRRIVWEGRVFLIKDNILSTHHRPWGTRGHKIFYATRGRKGKKVWHPTYEGVHFTAIRPFEVLK